MGLLDDLTSLAGAASGMAPAPAPPQGQSPGLNAGTLAALLPFVMQLVNSHGGIAGLIRLFQQKGLGDVAASWVGTGANLPISPQQIEQVLGSGPLHDLAAKAGVTPHAASQMLAQHLPSLVDHVTPQGQVPQGEMDLSSLAGLVGKIFG